MGELGVEASRLSVVHPMGRPATTVAGTGTVVAGGSVDAFCEQIVAGAVHTGDVLAIFGATLVVWVVADATDGAKSVPGDLTLPHTEPGRLLVGGPSNAGALFVDWVERARPSWLAWPLISNRRSTRLVAGLALASC